MDTWVLTSLEEAERRRQRWIYVLKARGIAHSDEMREFRIGDRGVDILSAERRTAEAARWRTRCSSCGSMSPARRRRRMRAFANLRKICDEHLAGRYSIEVIDLLEDPQLGRGDQILALPTLVRRLPAADQEDHRRPVEYRTGAGRAGSAPAAEGSA